MTTLMAKVEPKTKKRRLSRKEQKLLKRRKCSIRNQEETTITNTSNDTVDLCNTVVSLGPISSPREQEQQNESSVDSSKKKLRNSIVESKDSLKNLDGCMQVSTALNKPNEDKNGNNGRQKQKSQQYLESSETSLSTVASRNTTTSTIKLVDYKSTYIPTPISNITSSQDIRSKLDSSLGKWFPKAVVLKSSIQYDNSFCGSRTNKTKKDPDNDSVVDPLPTSSLLLFYQYFNPLWSTTKVDQLMSYLVLMLKNHRSNIGGRIRIAREGLNCTLSAADDFRRTNENKVYAAESLRHFTYDLQHFDFDSFKETDFKFHDNLRADRHFKDIKILPVQELVFYGGVNEETAPIEKTGIHVPPEQFRKMLLGEQTDNVPNCQQSTKKPKGTVVIDVRNHYEAAIGRFDGQMVVRNHASANMNDTKTADNAKAHTDSGCDASSSSQEVTNTAASAAAVYIDPKMRKSTDFTTWLDKDETKELLKDKNVLLYCTGGVRCERASAYLNHKYGTDVAGVYQLQGGIEKYLQEYPDGGDCWRGKNFVFDKREAVAPGNYDGDGGVLLNNNFSNKRNNNIDVDSTSTKKKKKNRKEKEVGVTVPAAAAPPPPSAHCCICTVPWDRYVGKKKCSTCGVPVLVCNKCMTMKLDVSEPLKRRCPLCVNENVTVLVNEVEYTNNGINIRPISSSCSTQQSQPEESTKRSKRMNHTNFETNSMDVGTTNINNSNDDKEKKQLHQQQNVPDPSSQKRIMASSVLKWGGGHGKQKKIQRQFSRKLCKFGKDCTRPDCFFYHEPTNTRSGTMKT